MEQLSQNFMNQLNALLACNPDRCAKAGCPLFYEEAGKCDALRFISTFSIKMKEKLEKVEKYSVVSEQPLV